MIVWRGSLPALIYPGGGDRVTWNVLAEYSWSPTTTQLGSFLCTAASSTPIRVVTKEVRYIHGLSLTLEHSMPISSLAAPGLTSPRALRSRVMQASSISEDVRRVLRGASGLLCIRALRVLLEQVVHPWSPSSSLPSASSAAMRL